MAFVAVLCVTTAVSLDNGVADLPPMGWSTWNAYGPSVDQTKVEASMLALAQPRSGRISLAKLGYIYAGLDDGWQACGKGVNGSFHDGDGNPLINKKAFPNMSAMTEFAHDHGLRAGWYMNNCICAENRFFDPRMIDRVVRQSAIAVASYGFDAVKLDSGSQFNNLTQWAAYLNDTGRPIAIENCHQGGLTPGQVIPGQDCTGTTDVSDCPYTTYRTSDDAYPTWGNMLNNVNSLVAFLSSDDNKPPRSRPGGWAYPDALQVGMMGVLSHIGYTPNANNWLPQPLVEDRSLFGMFCITSSPLVLGFNVTNSTLVDLVWPIIANTEAIAVNQHWAGSPGRLLKTIESNDLTHHLTRRPTHQHNDHHAHTQANAAPNSSYTMFEGQLGRAGGWGRDVPGDTEPGPHYMLLRISNTSIPSAETWCSSNVECGGFSYRVTKTTKTTVYFKSTSQLYWMDVNFKAVGPIQANPPWRSHVKSFLAPPFSFRKAPCAGTVCPTGAPPCHKACVSIVCCSANGPTGEAIDTSGAQVWTKPFRNGAVAVLFVNLDESITCGVGVSLSELGFNASTSVRVRDVWKHVDQPSISAGGKIMFACVEGHDSEFLILTPQ